MESDNTQRATSSLSAGEIIRTVLLLDGGVSAVTRKIYPVATDKAELPYVTYRRIGLESKPVKTGLEADSVDIQVDCYAARYGEGVDLAERVREALDNVSAEYGDLRMRGCLLTGAEEDWSDDAFVQTLVFTARISRK